MGWGVRFGDDAIIDRQAALFGQATTPIADDYAEGHPITALFAEPPLFPGTARAAYGFRLGALLKRATSPPTGARWNIMKGSPRLSARIAAMVAALIP